MDALQAEVPDVPLPYKVALPHTDSLVTTHRAMCFTGTRFINSFILSQAAEQPCDELLGTAAKRKRGAERQAAAAVAAALAPVPDSPEAKGIQLLAEVLNGEPRAHLSCEEAAHLVAAAAYGNATHVLEWLPAYLRPLLTTVSMSEVRLQQPHSTSRASAQPSGARVRHFAVQAVLAAEP